MDVKIQKSKKTSLCVLYHPNPDDPKVAETFEKITQLLKDVE
jgi:hypothetical protein